MMRRHRLALWTALLALAAVVLLVATGCGSASSSEASENASASTSISGATVTPASAPIFVSVNTDLSSSQWDAADKLLAKFPGRQKLLDRIESAIREEYKLDLQADVVPALGPELDIVVLDFLPGTNVVGLLQPADEAKWKAFVEKTNASNDATESDIAYERVGDWTVFSDSQAKIDIYKRRVDGTKLADDEKFRSATASLPAEALAKVYVDGARAVDAIGQRTDDPACFRRAVEQGGSSIESAVADVVAEDDGVRLEAQAQLSGNAPQGQAYEPALLDQVPSGALVFVSFNGKTFQGNFLQNFQAGFKCGANVEGVGQLKPVLDVLSELGKVLGGENAFYVRPGAGLPEVTLVTQPDDTGAAIAAIDRLVVQLGSLLGAPLTPHEVEVGGMEAKAIDLGDFTIYYGVKDKYVIVTDQQQAFNDLGASGPKLADDATYKEAVAAAGMPSQTNGFVYVNLKDAVPFVETFARLAGQEIPSDVSENLRPLRTFVAWSEGEKFSLFLEIK
jgi:Protein of unknown function (DUF3352)